MQIFNCSEGSVPHLNPQVVQLSTIIISFFLKKKFYWHISEWVKLLSRVQLSATLWTVAHQAPQSMGFSRQEYQGGLPFPSPGDLPDPGIEPRSPALQADTLTCEPRGWFTIVVFYNFLKISLHWWFPSVVENPSYNAGNVGLISGRVTKIPQVIGQLKPMGAATWDHRLWSLHTTTREKPAHFTRKISHATTKTRCSQKYIINLIVPFSETKYCFTLKWF